jgi:rhamnosyltransferase
MTETRIDAVVVTYNPEINLLKENVKSIESQVDVVFIVDNGSGNYSQIATVVQNFAENIELIRLKHNVGIAAAQNYGFEAALKDSASWVLTMDQDSIFPQNGISTFVTSTEFEKFDTGIMAPNFYDKRIGLKEKEGKPVEVVDFIISSGNLVSVRAWQAVGGFDEWMFIDYVDFDFDAKLARKGYKIVQFNSVTMRHELGTPPKNRPILRKLLMFSDEAVINDHSAFRQFYYYRNTLVFWKRYPEMLDKQRKAWHSRHLFLSLLSSMRRFFLFEHPWKKFFMASRGLLTGIMYRPKSKIN